MSYFASVSPKGWVVIPKQLRERFQIRPGSKVMLAESEKGILIIPVPPNPAVAYRGVLEGCDLVQELMKSRSEESEIEKLRAGQLRSADLLPE